NKTSPIEEGMTDEELQHQVIKYFKIIFKCTYIVVIICKYFTVNVYFLNITLQILYHTYNKDIDMVVYKPSILYSCYYTYIVNVNRLFKKRNYNINVKIISVKHYTMICLNQIKINGCFKYYIIGINMDVIKIITMLFRLNIYLCI